MKKILYNTNTQQLEANGRVFDGGYKIRGVAQKPFLPAHIKELEYIDAAAPIYDEATHRIDGFEWVADLNAETYTKVWNVVALSAKELAAIAWKYPQYPMRIIVDESVAEDNKGQKHFIRFSLNNTPVDYDEATQKFTVWLGGVDANYQAEFNNFVQQGKIVIEQRPQILD